MRTIPLTQGPVALVDDEDYEKLSKFKWCAQKSPTSPDFYAARKTPGKPPRPEFMHRVVSGALKGQLVYHLDHNTLNNCPQNLRVCTPTERAHNKRKQTNNTSGFIGVSWFAQRGLWLSKLKHKGRTIFLGYFDCKIEAAIVRDQAVKAMCAGFAVLNFPE